jgi:hypothetical protein
MSLKQIATAYLIAIEIRGAHSPGRCTCLDHVLEVRASSPPKLGKQTERVGIHINVSQLTRGAQSYSASNFAPRASFQLR